MEYHVPSADFMFGDRNMNANIHFSTQSTFY